MDLEKVQADCSQPSVRDCLPAVTMRITSTARSRRPRSRFIIASVQKSTAWTAKTPARLCSFAWCQWTCGLRDGSAVEERSRVAHVQGLRAAPIPASVRNGSQARPECCGDGFGWLSCAESGRRASPNMPAFSVQFPIRRPPPPTPPTRPTKHADLCVVALYGGAAWTAHSTCDQPSGCWQEELRRTALI